MASTTDRKARHRHEGEPSQPEGANKSAQHGIVRDGRGEDQPADKARAQHVSRKDRGDDPPGDPKNSQLGN